MPCPFPGMDPYLEPSGHWPDFHARFLISWSEAIADVIPDHYEVRIGERLWPRDVCGEDRRDPLAEVATVPSASTTLQQPIPTDLATLGPVIVPRPHLVCKEPPDRFIQVFRAGRELVTVLELLSPTNKAGPDRDDYLSKRNELMYQRVHLVELDLLIRGTRLPMGAPLPRGDYYALISRGDAWPDSQVYAWTVRQPLPTVPIPLNPPDQDARVDLGQVFANAYERGRYARSLSYDETVPVPLGTEDRDWSRECIRAMRRPQV